MTARVCILTDSTAQFTRAAFPGRDRVCVIPCKVQPAARQGDRPSPQQLSPPSPQDFIRHYTDLSRQYDCILVLTLSSQLSPVMEHALAAARQYSNHATVEVVDSQTTAIGLGMLAQAAAGLAAEGASLKEVEQRVRAFVPRIYFLLCIPQLTHLARCGYMDHSQALVGEMMGLMPLFSMEGGRLIPMEKVRTPRHLYEAFQEFVSEFEAPEHIALMRGVSHNTVRTRPLRQYVHETFPGTPFDEYPIQPPLAALFGPQSAGLLVVEKGSPRRA